MLENRQMFSETLSTTDVRIQRVAKKARINVEDNLAAALIQSWEHLKKIASDDFQEDEEIRASNLPELVHFLMELSNPPMPSTLIHADIVLSSEREMSTRKGGLTWASIMEEEPFEGEHWEGIFPAKGNQTRGDDTDSLSSIGSAFNSEPEGSQLDQTEDSETSLSTQEVTSDVHLTIPVQREYFRGSSLRSREIVEGLRRKQNWREESTAELPWNRPFNLADPSTFAATSDLAARGKLSQQAQPKIIQEVDAVRNVLLLLQGIDSPITTFMADDYGDRTQASIVSDVPRLMHLSFESYQSILLEFCFMATKLQEMRFFVKSVYELRERQFNPNLKPINSPSLSRTLEAFAEGVDKYIHDVEIWSAQQEETIVHARNGLGRPAVVTLLSCSHALKEKAQGVLSIIQDILRQVLKQDLLKVSTTHHRRDVEKLGFLRAAEFSSIPPYALATRLLDRLGDAVKTQFAIGELEAASTLSQLFVATAEPLWESIGKWIMRGMLVRLASPEDEDDEPADPELFVRRRDIEFVSPDFWEQGYTLQVEVDSDDEEIPNGATLVPDVFRPLAAGVLGAGKAVGLLRTIGIDPFQSITHGGLTEQWQPFRQVYKTATSMRSPSLAPEGDSNAMDGDKNYQLRVAFDSLGFILLEHVSPWCNLAQAQLKHLLFEDCTLMEHLTKIESFYFMRRGDAMSAFCDLVFNKLDAQQKWHDIHFLNTALRQTAKIDRKPWIEPDLIQFIVPFPLTYLLRRPSAQVYTSVFVLLLQLRRAKTVIERILLKGSLQSEEQTDANSFYALRGKFSWLLRHVLDKSVRTFHTELSKAVSLDEMIELHDNHLGRIQSLCLLQSKTAALHRTVLSILDLALYFGECLSTYMNERDNNSERQKDSTLARKRRRRHQRRARHAARNVIGFSDTHQTESTSSSSEGDVGELEEGNGDSMVMGPPALANSTSFAEESFVVKVDRMSEELDGLVRYVRKAVDVLAGTTTPIASIFGILSFMLEEWDL
ncbi:hypothetical protein PIIN_04651 [Serendipita indica DSM 11827]|uniref:Spindle pole body component n=1 Tax=Serendipita indica (strain DSM 11827) TaxID=1109443 RepID=G4THD1_SERID|nr:hypothetical protein PIIN_04651 [Serendipita indica DSM 11827]